MPEEKRRCSDLTHDRTVMSSLKDINVHYMFILLISNSTVYIYIFIYDYTSHEKTNTNNFSARLRLPSAVCGSQPQFLSLLMKTLSFREEELFNSYSTFDTLGKTSRDFHQRRSEAFQARSQ